MSDKDDNLLIMINDYLKLEFSIILKDLSDFISKVILILQDEYNKSGNKIVKRYIYSFESLGDSICYTPPELIKNDEEVKKEYREEEPAASYYGSVELKLAEPIIFTEYVGTICLPSVDKNYDNVLAIAVIVLTTDVCAQTPEGVGG